MKKGPFSEAEDAYLRAHYDDEIADLSAAMDRSRNVIRGRVYYLGLKRTARINRRPKEQLEAVRRYCEAGLSDTAAAAEMGCSAEHVRRIRISLGIAKFQPLAPDLTPEQRREMRALQAQGFGGKRIAHALGVSEYVIEREYRRARAALDDGRPEPNPKEEAFVARLLLDGGMPRLSEKMTRTGRVVCLPLVWDCAGRRAA